MVIAVGLGVPQSGMSMWTGPQVTDTAHRLALSTVKCAEPQERGLPLQLNWTTPWPTSWSVTAVACTTLSNY